MTGTLLSTVIFKYTPLKKRGAEFWGLCPFHKEKTPSFTVNDEKGLYHCFGCNAGGDAIEFVKQIEGVSFREARAILGGGLNGIRPQHQRTVSKIANLDNKNAQIARTLWKRGEPIKGTLAHQYLLNRGINIELPLTLRYCPDLYHDPSRKRLPALLAAASDENRKITGIQRIFLDKDGNKADVSPNKMCLGRIRGAAVRLSPIKPELVITEGIEDALTILEAKPKMAVWAVLGAHNLEMAPVPKSVKRLIIAADNDASGKEAADRAGQRLVKRLPRVEIARPPEGYKDFNELRMRDSENG